MQIGRLSAWPFICGVLIAIVIDLAVAVLIDGSQSNILAAPLVIVGVWLVILIIARLHDAGYSGWWWPLIAFTSLLGLIAVAAVGATEGINKYGAPPSGAVRDLLIFWKVKT
jgi:uncharacterized membrane protein YhaH (DUF805 family)